MNWKNTARFFAIPRCSLRPFPSKIHSSKVDLDDRKRQKGFQQKNQFVSIQKLTKTNQKSMKTTVNHKPNQIIFSMNYAMITPASYQTPTYGQNGLNVLINVEEESRKGTQCAEISDIEQLQRI